MTSSLHYWSSTSKLLQILGFLHDTWHSERPVSSLLACNKPNHLFIHLHQNMSVTSGRDFSEAGNIKHKAQSWDGKNKVRVPGCFLSSSYHRGCVWLFVMARRRKKKCHHTHRWRPDPTQMSKGTVRQPEHLRKRSAAWRNTAALQMVIWAERWWKAHHKCLSIILFPGTKLFVCREQLRAPICSGFALLLHEYSTTDR